MSWRKLTRIAVKTQPKSAGNIGPTVSDIIPTSGPRSMSGRAMARKHNATFKEVQSKTCSKKIGSTASKLAIITTWTKTPYRAVATRGFERRAKVFHFGLLGLEVL